ncbi:hypothetical protein PVT67_01315 [Gallaecimonas kandeliae]|uniref:DUF6916 family protein n=1 Tax=Gallaecimonas kandeliae TaxID=3029055 RepID=UPI0026475E8D|nr:hypothetical protein [Gallaecimonas kandeliae]WKE65929.1 hypothetical protein PVT67_01315 [Gallaecimonas kandeliae]
MELSQGCLSATGLQPHLHSYFHLLHDDTPVQALRLVDVTQHSAPQDPLDDFSMDLEGDPGAALAQGTYSFSHDQLGDFLFFMTTHAAGRYRIRIQQARAQGAQAMGR